jgi:hypothetical protein
LAVGESGGEEDMMRTRLFKHAWAAGLVAALVAISVPTHAAELSIAIPFSFVVNGRTLPPGTYDLSTERSVLLILDSRGGQAVLTMRLESREHDGAKLIFHKYGDLYILRQVWTGAGAGREIPRPALERELLETRRGTASAFERVTLAAL